MKRTDNFLIFMLLIILCAAVSFIFVWLLWKFATSEPRLYTALTLSAAGAVLIFMLISKIIQKRKKS